MASPSEALRCDIWLSRTMERRLSDTERPAASSDARLIRRAVASRSSDLDREASTFLSDAWARTELSLVLMRMATTSLWRGSSTASGRRQGLPISLFG